MHQEPRPGRRGVGNRAGELGVVGESVALVGVRPLPVEDVLSVTVRLQVKWNSTDKLAFVMEQQMILYKQIVINIIHILVMAMMDIA